MLAFGRTQIYIVEVEVDLQRLAFSAARLYSVVYDTPIKATHQHRTTVRPWMISSIWCY